MSLQGHFLQTSKCEDVHQRIFQSHLAYLSQEETPAKLLQRRNLESLISEFLSLVPHSQKFSCPEIANILHNSIDNPNFSSCKGASCFEALERYATNLLNHPWRKEYRVIKLYSGFYKHRVQNQLIGAETLFLLLGYEQQEHDDDLLFLDEPVDPDKVARVALDCITAYVECQIMVQICEKVKSFKCTWPEIHHVRQEYVCGIDEAVRILHQLKRAAVDQEKHDRWLKSKDLLVDTKEKLPFPSEGKNSYQKTGVLVDVSNNWSNDTSVEYNDNGLTPHSSHYNSQYPLKSQPQGNLLPTHSKSPSWSDGVLSPIDGWHGRLNSSVRSDDLDDLSRTLHNQVLPNVSLMENHRPQHKVPVTSQHVDSKEDSWDLLDIPVSRHPFQDGHGLYTEFEKDGHRFSYGQLPPPKTLYASPPFIPPPFQSPIVPLAVSGYPYGYPMARQCQCRMCCEQQVSLIQNRVHHKEVPPHFIGPDSLYNRSERLIPDGPMNLSSSLYQMSLGQSIEPKPAHFPTDGLIYPPPRTINDNIGNEVPVMRTSSSHKSHNVAKRGSFYDNVPTSPDIETGETSSTAVAPAVSSGIGGKSSTAKKDNSLAGSSLVATPISKTKSQKGITVTDLANSESVISVKGTHLKLDNSDNGTTTSGLPQSSKVAVISTDSKATSAIKSPLISNRRDSKDGKKWSCISCTYYNTSSKCICDMCGRSRYPGAESTPLVSGGRECPQCTLVNGKDAEDCSACGASLKDSPTYI